MNEHRKLDADGHVLEVLQIGDSLGVVLPPDMLARLGLKAGDRLQAVEQPGHGVNLSPYDAKRTRALAIARGVMDKYEETFRILAK